MKTILHKAESRGKADYGWLKANYSFSFANWYDPQRMRFGLLRVLNDDTVEPSRGFDTHPHDNMEIITIPLKGSVAHRDSTGGEGIISAGEIQVMSAGSGVYHSEFNASDTEQLNLLQIWIFPKKRNIEPRYEQKKFDTNNRKNRFQIVVSPDGRDGSLKINQDAYFSLSDMERGKSLEYIIKNNGNGIYLFVIDGKIQIGKYQLSSRDALGITGTESFRINALENSKVLIIEVPMN
ncbi:MAG: pirin family protein [Ignavibacteria bacterium]|nr:pirin family protein [Ignavibacteria bacterium]